MAPTLFNLLIALGFVLCWSSGFVGGRLAVESSLPVLALFTWRFLIAGMMAGLWWRISNLGRVDRGELVREAGIGSLTMGGYLLGVILAIQFGVSAGVTALITALQPLLAAALAGSWLGERLSALGWIGMIIATAGVALCVVDDMGNGSAVPLWAYTLPLFSVVSVTLGSLFAVKRAPALPMAATLTVQLAAATVIFAVAALIAGGGRIQLPSAEPATLLSMSWLILLSSFGGYGFFVASLRLLGVTLTSTLVYLTPPVTLVWAAVMFGERPGAWGVAGMAVAVSGVGLAMLGVRRRYPKPNNEFSSAPLTARQ